MKAFIHHFKFEFLAGIRNKQLLLLNYLFPLGFYLMLGFIMVEINPPFRENVVPAMVIFGILSATLLGIPDPLVNARENGIPFFGICLGMQCAAIEFSRNILGHPEAHTTEINPETPFPVIDIMEKQKEIKNMGGTMRLGSYECKLDKNSKSFEVYQKDMIRERHRHRFEFNNKYRELFEASGMRLAGINPKEDLVEIIELVDHPWFVGVQFHPEYKSTVRYPHPLFVGFIKAAIDYKNKN